MTKKGNFEYFILLLIAFLIGTLNVDAVQNPYKEAGPYGTNCTWYAWKNAYEIGHIALPGWGNAKTWADYAIKAGFEVGTTPRNNSILVYPSLTAWGHVVYIEKVDGGFMYAYDTGTACYDENSSAAKACLDSTTDPETGEKDYDEYNSCLEKNAKIIGCKTDITYYYDKSVKYIYLDTAPKTTNSSSTNSGTAVQKSNNANLSELKISNVDFEFDKNTLQYKIEVKSDIEKVNVSAKAEDSKAKITGTGDYDIKLGLNTINVEVIAENGTKKNYTVEINKLDNNAFLNVLSIANVDFEFKKDVFEYSIDVDYETKRIMIEAITESEKAEVEGVGSYDLNVGKNEVDIKVLAEDRTENIYKVTINRKEQEQIKENNSNKNLIIYIGGGILFTAVLVTSIIIIFKKHKKYNN